MNNLKRLLGFIRPYFKQMALAAILLMAVAVTNLSLLWILRSAIDAFLHEPNEAALNTAILALLGLLFVQGVLTMGHSYLIAFIGHRVVADFRMRLFKHISSLDLSFFTKRRTGELISRLTSDVAVTQHIITDVPIDLAKQMVGS